jgi:serine/threonine protein kinase
MIPSNLPENGALAAKRRALAAKRANAQNAQFQSPQQPQQQPQTPLQSNSTSQQSQQPSQAQQQDGGLDKLPFEQEDITSVGCYQVIESIGRGAFGIVYRGLSPTFETVAIKRVYLPNVPVSELESIEMEIQLLKNLKHNNIVEYRDALRTSSHLNIVLEFVENGSLSSLLGKMKGRTLGERFVAHYTYQVLGGLAYLHTQGVIHRDIKGANILSTKQGLVKLADFGVATKLNDSRKSDSVVGTPYWMAPEIIEMKGGQSPACDIWSVGCTVIELLTGKPPYFDLPQMTALFKIVQDDLPPLPDGISPTCEDFLRECFQKDPVRRPPAEKLLKHPWLKEAASSIQELEATTPANGTASSTKSSINTKKSPKDDDDDPFGSDFDDGDSKVMVKPTPTASTTNKSPAIKKNLSKWAEKNGDGSDDEWGMNDETPAKSNAKSTALGGSTKPKTAAVAAWDDGDDDDWGDISEPVQVNNNARRATLLGNSSQLSSPSIIKGGLGAAGSGVSNVGTSGAAAKKVNLDDFAGFDDSDDEFGDLDLDSKITSITGSKDKATPAANLVISGHGTMKKPVLPTTAIAATQHTRSLDNIHGNDDDDDDFDPFEDLEFQGQDETTLLMVQFDKYVQELNTHITDPLLATKAICDNVDKLTTFIANNPTLTSVLPRIVLPLIDLLPNVEEPALYSLTSLCILLSQSTLLQQHHVFVLLIPALLPFAGPTYTQRVRMAVCTIINGLCRYDDFTRRVFIASGGLQILLDLLCSDHNDQQNEWLILLSTIESLKILLTNGKNDLLRTCCNYNGPLQISTTLFRLACAAVGVVPVEHGKLIAPTPSTTGTNSHSNLQTLSQVEMAQTITISKLPIQLNSTFSEPITKLVSILELFANGDSRVKEHLYNIKVFRLIVNLLPLLQQEGTTPILKILRVLSTLPSAHPVFEETQAIPILVSFLYSSVFEHQHHSLQCLYHLCSTNAQRQFRAVQSGIVPILINNIKQRDPLAHFAYPMLCWFTQTAIPRLEVRKNGGFELLLETLTNPSFNLQALDALFNLVFEKHDLHVPSQLQSVLGDEYKKRSFEQNLLPGQTPFFSVNGDASVVNLESGLQRYLSIMCQPANLIRILFVTQSCATSGIRYEHVMNSLEKMLARSRHFVVLMSIFLLPELSSRLPHFKSQNNVRSAILNVLKVCLSTLTFEFIAPKPAHYFTQPIRDNLFTILRDSLGPTLHELIQGSQGFALIKSRAQGCMSEINKILATNK